MASWMSHKVHPSFGSHFTRHKTQSAEAGAVAKRGQGNSIPHRPLGFWVLEFWRPFKFAARVLGWAGESLNFCVAALTDLCEVTRMVVRCGRWVLWEFGNLLRVWGVFGGHEFGRFAVSNEPGQMSSISWTWEREAGDSIVCGDVTPSRRLEREWD